MTDLPDTTASAGTATAPTDQQQPVDPVYGICCSGGGIRAAAFALGALLGLEENKDLVARARYLSAVSGGNYAATGWTLSAMNTAAGGTSNAAERLHVSLFNGAPDPGDRIWVNATADDPIERTITNDGDHRYLRNGVCLGLFGNLAWAFGLIMLHALVLLSAMFVAGWGFGKVMGSEVLHPEYGNPQIPDSIAFGRLDWVPAAILGGLAVIAFAVAGVACLFVSSNVLYRAARWVAIAALASVLIPIAIPWTILEVRHALHHTPGPGGTTGHTLTVAGISATTLIGWLWALAKGKVKRSLPYLGGLAMAILLLIFMGVVVQATAFEASDSWLDVSGALWAALAIVLVVLYAVGPGIQWASFRPIYTGGLQHSFGERASGLPDSDATWSKMREVSKCDDDASATRVLPELIVCCAAQRVGLSQNGVPATSFTITPTKVALDGRVEARTEVFTKRIRSKNLATTLERPSGWMAISGAAFASAMGRSSLGTTNALLAGLGINLGAWVPSPRKVDGQAKFPLVRMPYFLKEIFGVYPADDDFVFVTDGGHWENLGLVELLRRNCRTIACFDASGDEPGSFNTLREALSLALTELGNVKSFDLTALDAASVTVRGLLPPTSVFEIPVTFKDGIPGRIFYA
ncbi:MAG: hypothetical protein WCK21_05525, partial [Actinomycetota bacterium]